MLLSNLMLAFSSSSVFFSCTATASRASASLYSVFGVRMILASLTPISKRPAFSVTGASIVSTVLPFFSFHPPVKKMTTASTTTMPRAISHLRRCRWIT